MVVFNSCLFSLIMKDFLSLFLYMLFYFSGLKRGLNSTTFLLPYMTYQTLVDSNDCFSLFFCFPGMSLNNMFVWGSTNKGHMALHILFKELSSQTESTIFSYICIYIPTFVMYAQHLSTNGDPIRPYGFYKNSNSLREGGCGATCPKQVGQTP